MDTAPLRVRTLGEFSILRGDRKVTVSQRSPKLCLLLACLIQERGRALPCGELIGLLWEGQALTPASLNALKAILHRARGQLNQLWEGAGRALILSRAGGYQWNDEIPLTLDAEEFVRLCRAAQEEAAEEGRLALQQQALALYPGDYLPSLEGHPWAAGRAGQLHQLYLRTVLGTLPLLSAREMWEELAGLAEAALALEPLREELCLARLEALLRLDRPEEAARTYEAFQERLLARTGVMPSDALREHYRELQSRCRDPRSITPATLLERLQEPATPGALICEYDFFRVVCHCVARMAGRSGGPVHVALISVVPAGDSPLPQYSLKRVMDNLEEIIRRQLRRGDAAARCGASQFVLLLPQATYQNGQMVCTRIRRAFVRQFPHSPARIQISVQPLPTEDTEG